MTDITQRIKELMNYYELNISETASQLGVPQSNLSAILSGKRPIGINTINKFVISFDINKEWLESGVGNMFNLETSKIGLRMFIARKDRKWTSKIVADLLNISLQEYKDIESGKIIPSKEIIENFIYYSNANPSWIYNGNGTIFTKEYNQHHNKQDERQKNLISRLETLLGSANMSFSDLAIKCKISHSELADFFNAKKYDPENKIIDTISISTGANKNWLLTGLGDPFEPGSYLDNKCAETFNNLFSANTIDKSLIKDKYPIKPFIDSVYAVCGTPSGFSVAIKENECEGLSLPFMKEYDFSIKAKGDSMINRNNPARSIREGDIVVCRLWKSRSHVRWGEVYALATSEGVIIKKLQESEKQNHVKCVSFNTEDDFTPYDLPVEEIFDWAIVTGVVSTQSWN